MMFKWSVLFAALLVAGCAAVFSVTGIASLFAGHYGSVIVMAASLELGKLVAVSFLYRYWRAMSKSLRCYLVVASVVLSVVTSAGIYGYLSAGYAAVAATPQLTLNELARLDAQSVTLADNITRLQQDNSALNTRRDQIQKTLDAVLAGSTQLNQKSAFANLRGEAARLDKERTVNMQVSLAAQHMRDSVESEKVRLNGDLNTQGKIGQFVYVAKTLGVPLDSIVKWFVLLLVFVFDPLAVSLILAYNTIARKERETTPNPKLDLWAKKPTEVMERAVKRYEELVKPVTAAPTSTPTPELVTVSESHTVEPESSKSRAHPEMAKYYGQRQ